MKPEQKFDVHCIRSKLAAIGRAVLAASCMWSFIGIAQSEERNPSLAQPIFPPIESALRKDGTFPSLDAIRQVQPGMDKDQVQSLLSRPHFSEGFVGVKEWNYIFHFRNAGPDTMTCQFMVRFSSEMLTTGAFWKSDDCANFAERAQTKIVVKSIEAPMLTPLVPQTLTLISEEMFRRDEASAAELRPVGLRIVELLATEIRGKFGVPLSILVTGYNPGMRSDIHDDARSLAQANAVRNALVRYGVDPGVVQVTGTGNARPLAVCAAGMAPRERLICERTNRRIEIHISGAQ